MLIHFIRQRGNGESPERTHDTMIRVKIGQFTWTMDEETDIHVFMMDSSYIIFICLLMNDEMVCSYMYIFILRLGEWSESVKGHGDHRICWMVLMNGRYGSHYSWLFYQEMSLCRSISHTLWPWVSQRWWKLFLVDNVLCQYVHV